MKQSPAISVSVIDRSLFGLKEELKGRNIVFHGVHKNWRTVGQNVVSPKSISPRPTSVLLNELNAFPKQSALNDQKNSGLDPGPR